MRDYDPNNRPMMGDTTGGPDNLRDRRSGMGWLGTLLAIAVVLGLGLFAWSSMNDGSHVANNTAPGVTTGSGTSAPSSAPTAPATPSTGPTNTR